MRCPAARRGHSRPGRHPGAIGDATDGNGITLFPGGIPLYKGGVLVGGIGVSGDGVDQDDYVASAGSAGFEPPDAIRCDNYFIRGARLPYVKFPRIPRRECDEVSLWLLPLLLALAAPAFGQEPPPNKPKSEAPIPDAVPVPGPLVDSFSYYPLNEPGSLEDPYHQNILKGDIRSSARTSSCRSRAAATRPSKRAACRRPATSAPTRRAIPTSLAAATSYS